MSRVGKKPIDLPGGVQVAVRSGVVDVSGPKGKMSWSVPAPIEVRMAGDGKRVEVVNPGVSKESRALHGLSRSLVANMVEGVSNGFSKTLLIYGTGYGCNLKGRTLELNVGFMGRGTKTKAQFEVSVPAGVEVNVEVAAARGETDPAKLVISGCDKQAVGHFAAAVRKIRPPEPYKGKGIRYSDEVVRRKQGKALAGSR